MQWQFEVQDPRYRARNSVTDEFFADEAGLNDVDSLVRESIQNSLDASISGQNSPVRVVFSLGETTADKGQKWFGSLKPHLEAALGTSSAALVASPCRYLTVEDFQTTGLVGDPHMPIHETHQNSIPKDQLSYYYFVHAEGESSKDGRRGTWGVGKIVFHKLSRAKTFMFLSDRMATSGVDTVAMGQTILKMHTIGETRFVPDGWLSEVGASGLHVPLTPDISAEMRSNFAFTPRQREVRPHLC